MTQIFSGSCLIYVLTSQYFECAFQLNRVSLHHAMQDGGEWHEGLGCVGQKGAWDWNVSYSVAFQLTIELLMNVYLGFSRAVGQNYTRSFENQKYLVFLRNGVLAQETDKLYREVD